jgi:hypothetical protein
LFKVEVIHNYEELIMKLKKLGIPRGEEVM